MRARPAAELARTVDHQAYAAVEKNLADLQAQVLKHREELTFYRGIVSPEDGIGGLRIQRFQVLPGAAEHHYRLRLVLVQSMRQETVVSGAVVVHIEGVRDNKPEQLELSEAGAQTRANGQLPFRFRYFQNLEQDIVLPDGFEPRARGTALGVGYEFDRTYPDLIQQVTPADVHRVARKYFSLPSVMSVVQPAPASAAPTTKAK